MTMLIMTNKITFRKVKRQNKYLEVWRLYLNGKYQKLYYICIHKQRNKIDCYYNSFHPLTPIYNNLLLTNEDNGYFATLIDAKRALVKRFNQDLNET